MSRRKQHMFTGIYEQCPPESPHQLYTNAALDAVGEEYGNVLEGLSEEVTQLVIDAATTAASAALEAAHVGDDWRDVVKSSKRRETPKRSAQWVDSVIDNPIDLYQAMAWEFKERERLALFDERDSDERREELIYIIDAMLAFALNAAGVDGAWERTYKAAVAKVKGNNRGLV